MDGDVIEGKAVVVYEKDRPLTILETKEQVQLIQQVMASVMKEGTHYGTIPGTPKPTLYKAGAEKLLSTFRIAADPSDVTDLSGPDEVRYRVRVICTAQDTGVFLGAGVGECSSNEEKYKWRKPVCQEEYDETPDSRKRTVWKRYGREVEKNRQVRMSPSDVANTVLLMAVKRALVSVTRVVTACSDVFDQDIEDLPAELVQGAQRPEVKRPQEKADAKTDGKQEKAAEEGKKEAPPAQQEMPKGKAKILVSLMRELADYCSKKGLTPEAVLKDLTVFKNEKDEDVWMRYGKINTYGEAWLGKALGELRKRDAKEGGAPAPAKDSGTAGTLTPPPPIPPENTNGTSGTSTPQSKPINGNKVMVECPKIGNYKVNPEYACAHCKEDHAACPAYVKYSTPAQEAEEVPEAEITEYPEANKGVASQDDLPF